jgi:hypothetical protein
MARVLRADDLVPEPGRSPRFEGHAHGSPRMIQHDLPQRDSS